MFCLALQPRLSLSALFSFLPRLTPSAADPPARRPARGPARRCVPLTFHKMTQDLARQKRDVLERQAMSCNVIELSRGSLPYLITYLIFFRRLPAIVLDKFGFLRPQIGRDRLSMISGRTQSGRSRRGCARRDRKQPGLSPRLGLVIYRIVEHTGVLEEFHTHKEGSNKGSSLHSEVWQSLALFASFNYGRN